MFAAGVEATNILRQAINPSNGVFALIALTEFKELIEVFKSLGLGINPRPRHAFELKLNGGDETGEPKTPDCCLEKFVARLQSMRFAVAGHQSDCAHVFAKGSGTVMILAMNVVSYGSAKRYKCGAWRYRQQPTSSDEGLLNVF